MDWRVYALGIALFLIFEAFIPAISPQLWKQLVKQISQVDEPKLQKIAISVVVLGLFIFGLVSIYGK